MIQFLYAGIFTLSLIFTAIYVYVWHKHFDVNFTMIFMLVPVSCLGYLMFYDAKSLEEAVRAQQITYIGGCFLQLFITLSIFSLCQIPIKRWLRTVMFAVCACLYATVLMTGHFNVFYKNFSFKMAGDIPVLTREYGVMHTVFYAVVIVLFLSGLSAIIYSLLKKKQIPRTMLFLMLIPDVICVISYFLLRKIIAPLDLVPCGYIMAQFIYLLIIYRVNLYDVSNTVIDSMIREKGIGYISFDFKYRYLGSNEVAKEIVPGLLDTAVDELFGYKPGQRKIRHFLDAFKRDPADNTFVYSYWGDPDDDDDDRFYNTTVNFLYDGNRKRGYIVTFTDDTTNRKYIRLLDTYNENLREEVEEKTRHIVDMHDNLIMSLAMMVESRDNSTGGHIKRTSEGVRILVDEIEKEGVLQFSEEFIHDVIKAAPMHDLGKIAVDDAVLRKPGRFTDEEYEKMKCHAAEGARVIHEILLHTDDESFKEVAENVAHYHHERWDGSGYPEKLSGERIPIEARIMAIADVYDALVSKRVYKEAFDFEKADNIILEGMGTQFDPGLKNAYISARPRLENYYRSV